MSTLMSIITAILALGTVGYFILGFIAIVTLWVLFFIKGLVFGTSSSESASADSNFRNGVSINNDLYQARLSGRDKKLY